MRGGPGYTAGGSPAALVAAPTSAPTLAHQELFSLDDSELGGAQEPLGEPVAEPFYEQNGGRDVHGATEVRSVSERHTVTVTLSAADYSRLAQRARVRGVSVEDCLRGLI